MSLNDILLFSYAWNLVSNLKFYEVLFMGDRGWRCVYPERICFAFVKQHVNHFKLFVWM